MTILLKEEQKIIKGEDGKWIFINDFHKEITEDDAKKFITMLTNNIRTLKNNLKFDINVELEKEKQKMLLRYEIAKDALLNYEAYEKKIIKEMKSSRKQRKEDFQKYVDDFEIILKKNLDAVEAQIESVINNWKMQLEMEESHLKLYKDAGFDIPSDDDVEEKK